MIHIEEYKTIINDEMSAAIKACAIKLVKTKAIKKNSKYAITKFALKTMLEMVETIEKRQRAELNGKKG